MKVKIKLSLSTALRHVGGGVGVQLHLFLTSTLDGDEWLSSCSSHLTPGKEPRYPLNRRLDGLWSHFRRCEDEKNSLAHKGIRTVDYQPIA